MYAVNFHSTLNAMTYQNEVDDIQFMQNDDHSYYLIFFKHATKEVFIYGLWQMDDGLKKLI